MQDQEKINAFYNIHAQRYASRYLDELQYKPLDRIVLREFVNTNSARGSCLDLGCGPGQTTAFLHTHGMTDIRGIDASEEMIALAQTYHPDISFRVGDMLDLPFGDGMFSSAIAFYAIVNLDYDQLVNAFGEIYRVLKADAEFLLSFHTGVSIIHLDSFEGAPADIDFYLFEMDRVLSMLIHTGFRTLTAYERLPYPDEYPSKRGYLWMRKQ